MASFSIGVGLGLAIAVPIGPMGLLCIYRTLVMGVTAGVATGFGAATVHLGYIALTALGLGPVTRIWLKDGAAALSLASALALLWFAVGAFRRKVVITGQAPAGRISLLRSYLSAIALGVANPSTILLVAAALPTLAHVEDAAPAGWLVGGVFAGSIAWWITLATIVVQLRGRVSARVLGWGGKASAVALAGLAAAMLVAALDPGS